MGRSSSAMKYLSNIPLVRAATGDVLPGNTFSSIVLSSAHTNWQNLVVEEHLFANHELDGFMYIQHVVAVNLGPAIACEFKKDGRFQHMSKARNSIFDDHILREFADRDVNATMETYGARTLCALRSSYDRWRRGS
jgi:hypothetical protein